MYVSVPLMLKLRKIILFKEIVNKIKKIKYIE